MASFACSCCRPAYFQVMNKRELAAKLAKQSHTSKAKAADDVDSLVYGLLKDLKQTEKQGEKTPDSNPPKPPAKESKDKK